MSRKASIQEMARLAPSGSDDDETTAAAIERDERRVRELQVQVDNCRSALAHAVHEYDVARSQLVWRRLMAQLRSDSTAQQLEHLVNDAISAFETSLKEPANYDNDDGVPFADTDDYADFAPVEKAVDEALDRVESEFAAGHTATALLMLLVVTIRVGELARRDETSGALPPGEYDEMKDDIVEAWQDAVVADERGLDEATKAEWRFVIEHHIGPPFESAIFAAQ